MMNEMRNLPRGINWQQVRWLTGYSDGVCATLCGKTESATSIVDIGDITLKTIKSYILLRPTWNERCNSPNIHCLDSVTIIGEGGGRPKLIVPWVGSRIGPPKESCTICPIYSPLTRLILPRYSLTSLHFRPRLIVACTNKQSTLLSPIQSRGSTLLGCSWIQGLV